MRIVRVDKSDKLPRSNNRDGLVARSEQPLLPDGIKDDRVEFRQLQHQDSYFLSKTALDSRVLIIEGISGSGKDTFQRYLKERLNGRHLHDYSEGEVLHSWKHLKIEGILELRVKFMRHFVKYIRDSINLEPNSVFILNRFHLSAYVSTIIQQPKLEKEYDQIINILRTLPVHVFILQLHENEIEKRSLHPERSSAWRKHQQQILKKEGFRDRLERYLWQQRLILETAKKQQIPYSVIQFPCLPENWTQIDSWARSSNHFSFKKERKNVSY